MYKPPKPVTQNRPSKYKPPGGLYLENCPQIQSKTKPKVVNFGILRYIVDIVWANRSPPAFARCHSFVGGRRLSKEEFNKSNVIKPRKWVYRKFIRAPSTALQLSYLFHRRRCTHVNQEFA